MLNITLIIILIVTLCLIRYGWKRGMAKQLSGFVALVVTLGVASLMIMLYSSFKRGEAGNTIFSIVLLVITGSVYGIVKIFLKSLKAISHLPVLNFMDRVMGGIIGFARGVIFVWIFFFLLRYEFMGNIAEYVRTDICNSRILTALYQYDIFIR